MPRLPRGPLKRSRSHRPVRLRGGGEMELEPVDGSIGQPTPSRPQVKSRPNRVFYFISMVRCPLLLLLRVFKRLMSTTERQPSPISRIFILSLAHHYLLATLYAFTLRLLNDGALTYRIHDLKITYVYYSDGIHHLTSIHRSLCTITSVNSLLCTVGSTPPNVSGTP